VEEIRLTILNNLLQYHPEAGSNMAWGAYSRKESSRDLLSPLGEKNRCAGLACLGVSLRQCDVHSCALRSQEAAGLLEQAQHRFGAWVHV